MSPETLVEAPILSYEDPVAETDLWATAIEHSPALTFLSLTLMYAIVAFSMSSLKLLWLDELITLHIARLGSISAIWHALGQGVDPNPPLTHILVHISRLVLGEHEYSLRLPAIVGYWIGLLSLFSYLRSRVRITWALSGTVLSMTMAAFDYSYESRSYAIFYGLAMSAFFCWTRSADESRSLQQRRLGVAGMVLALAAGVTTNYFAVLAFIPIAAGEFTRLVRVLIDTARARSPRFTTSELLLRESPVWIGMLVASMPLLAFRSMIAHSIAQFAPYAWNKVSLEQVSDSYTQMVEIILYPLLGLIAFGIVVKAFSRLCPVCRKALWPRWFGALATRVRTSRPAVPLYEAVGILFLMAYPFLGYVVASKRGGMLSPRFVIPVCFGFAIAGTLTAFRLFGHYRRVGVLLLGLYVAWFLSREAYVGYWYEEQKQCFYKVVEHLPEAEACFDPDSPIVIPDPLMALTFQHYAPPSMVARIVFPLDFPAIRNFRRDDSAEENLWAGRNLIYTLPIMPLATFQKTAGKYLILASDGNWLIEDLRDHHYVVDRLPVNTRAGAIGGFTPLNHGLPVFFTATGDVSLAIAPQASYEPIPFNVTDELPNALHYKFAR